MNRFVWDILYANQIVFNSPPSVVAFCKDQTVSTYIYFYFHDFPYVLHLSLNLSFLSNLLHLSPQEFFVEDFTEDHNILPVLHQRRHMNRVTFSPHQARLAARLDLWD